MNKPEINGLGSWISLATFVLVIAQGIYFFGFGNADTVAAIQELRKEDVRIYEYIDTKTTDRIYGQTVNQMFNNHQLQIENLKNSQSSQTQDLKDRIDRIDARIQEQNSLLQETLKELRKIPHS